MNKKISLGTAVTIAAIAAALAVAITMVYSLRTFNDKLFNIKEREATYEKIAEIDKIVRSKYFGSINEDRLMDSIAQGYVDGIGDKYAVYLTADQYQQQKASLEGSMVDVGIVVEDDASGYLKIAEVYSDSPAFAAGLEPEDLIVKIDELDLSTVDFDTAKEALTGESGTKVTLTVRKEGEELEPMELTRRRVDRPTVYYTIYDNVAYLQITEFADATPTQFNKALEQVITQGAQALVFDVRNNPGGTINSVASVLDRLLPAGDIVSATYRDGSTEVLATSDEREVDMPMAVITNERSASAAELFTQALKDYNKARSVGVTTYGKGLMQTIYQLDDGSALDITVAKYNPPKSPNFDGVGVKPDYEVRLTADQEKIFDMLDEETDPQLRKALELVRAEIVQEENAQTVSSSSPAEEEEDEE